MTNLILSYLMRIRCDATRPSNESTTFVILLRHYLHYNVNQHFQGRALQEAEGSFLRPATVKALCHTFFARGFAVLIKHSSSNNWIIINYDKVLRLIFQAFEHLTVCAWAVCPDEEGFRCFGQYLWYSG